MPRKSRWVVGLALSLAVAGRARAEFITFEGIAPPGGLVNYEYGSTRVLNGFNVYLVLGSYIDGAWRPNDFPDRGTSRAVFLGNWGMRISLPSGGPFAIHSFDAAEWRYEYPGGQKLYAFGLLADGVTVLKTAFTTPARPAGAMSAFHTYTFGPGWDKVVDVWLTAIPTLQEPGDNYISFALDKISVTPAPEPGSLALLGSGAVAALGYSWRRRRAARGPKSG